MSKFFRYSFLVIGLGVLVSIVSVTQARGQILGEILRRMDVNNKSLQSLQANVTMVKYNPQLDVSDTLTGGTSYLPKAAKRGMYVRIDWKTENGRPMEESISVIGDDYELYRKRVNQVITGKVGKAKNNASVGGALGFMSMSRDQLKANYNVQFIAEEKVKGGVPTWHLLLTPKAATSYKSADLWVDANGMPLQARITEQNNDSTTVLLENIRKNETLNATIFKLQYPSSAKKIKA
jgi:outer membrane lipoprotein-sorting protein